MKMDRFLALQIFTGSRVLIAALAVLVLVGSGTGVTALLIVAVLAFLIEMTDLFDGILARKYGMESDFGKLFDPYTDSVARLGLYFGMGWVGLLPLWLPIGMSFRDISVSYVRLFSMQTGTVMGARMSGKVKAWVQAIGTFLFLLLALLKQLGLDLTILVTPAALIVLGGTLWSLVDYVVSLAGAAGRKG